MLAHGGGEEHDEQAYLPISPYISLYLPMHLPISPYASPYISMRTEAERRQMKMSMKMIGRPTHTPRRIQPM